MKWLVCKYGRYKARVFKLGDVVELDAETAKFVNEDEPGTLEPYVAALVVEARQVEQPAGDRMVRRGDAETRGRGDTSAKSGRKH